MANEEIKIVIDYEKIKAKALSILVRLNDFYLKLNQGLLFFWRKALSLQSENRWTNALKTLIENPATALFLNTILFAVIGTIFGGLIERILFIGAGLNIILFCANILGWKDKLKK